ncbi:C-reactive protein-like [Cheilinus undulatus]|uniref:C-reactive protein-like n=1 Tax=Cheilinus undulatus TaxID=241271 RepID=UPI001BD59CF9|nr:C-reactive protein-like [Cheilinus undulatus]
MKLLVLMVILTSCAASPRDLSDKMFTFPLKTRSSYVKLIPSVRALSSLTVCHRSFTDLKRNHVLLSLATPTNPNAFLTFWHAAEREMETTIKDMPIKQAGIDYKPNTWHSICTTFDSASGLLQMWFNGEPLVRKYTRSSIDIQGPLIIIIGQEQDSHGGGFDIDQSFIGMMSDIHIWDYPLSACEIHNYMDRVSYTPGNVISWKALEYQIFDRVVLEEEQKTCR